MTETTKLNTPDREAMRLATMGCWWTSRAYPKSQPVWSGIANELYVLALSAEDRGDMDEAREMSRLGHKADQLTLTSF